jgi:putative transposase
MSVSKKPSRGQGAGGKPAAPKPKRGRRYGPGEKKAILEAARGSSMLLAAAEYGVSPPTLYRWRDEAARRGPGGKDPAEERRDLRASHRKAILDTWKAHPGFGPNQVRNTLRRERSLKASVTTVRAVMEEEGYVAPLHRSSLTKEPGARYEAVRPRELYHLDFYHFHVHKQKQVLLFIVDDFSRFITGWSLSEVETADAATLCFEKTVTRYGKPEGVMSDRGAAFHAWKGASRFQRLMDEYGVNFFVAKRPQSNGKVEALNATFQRELLRQVEMASLADAQLVISDWVERYNHTRVHTGLGGVLVPADRFYGLTERTLRLIENGSGEGALDLLSPEHRGLEVFKVISRGGNPEVYICGKRILG